MKKHLIFIGLTIALLGYQPAAAQQQSQRTPQEQAQQLTNKMTEKYDLSEAQSAQALPINEAFVGNMRRLKETSGDDQESRRKSGRAYRQAYHQQMKEILTPEQFERWKADQKARMAKRRAQKQAPTNP